MANAAIVDHNDGVGDQKRTGQEIDEFSRPPLPRRQPNPEEGIAAAALRVNGASVNGASSEPVDRTVGDGRRGLAGDSRRGLAGDSRRAARHARHALRAEAEDQIPILRNPIPAVRDSAPALPARTRSSRYQVATDHPSLPSVNAAPAPAPAADPVPPRREAPERSSFLVDNVPSNTFLADNFQPASVGEPDSRRPRPHGADADVTTSGRESAAVDSDPAQTPSAPPETSTIDEVPPNPEKVNLPMSNYHDATNKALGIEGALGFAIVDSKSGMAMAVGGDPGFDLSIAAAGNSSVVQAKLRTINELELNENIEDILITLGKQFHIIRVTEADPSVFLYLVLSRARANLAMARYQLTKIEGQLRL